MKSSAHRNHASSSERSSNVIVAPIKPSARAVRKAAPARRPAPAAKVATAAIDPAVIA